jgi:hypothetical protein
VSLLDPEKTSIGKWLNFSNCQNSAFFKQQRKYIHMVTDGLFRSMKFADEFEYHGHCDLETEVEVNLSKICISELFNGILKKYYMF